MAIKAKWCIYIYNSGLMLDVVALIANQRFMVMLCTLFSFMFTLKLVFIQSLHLISVGVLGSLNLDDLSPHGHLHSCKFTTLSEKEPNNDSPTGTNALLFDVFK